MTTSITAVSASTRSAQSIRMPPECIQSSTGVTVAFPASEIMKGKIGQDSRHDTNSAPVVTSLGNTAPNALLANPATIAASNGRKTMKRITCYPFIRLTSSTEIVPRLRK